MTGHGVRWLGLLLLAGLWGGCASTHEGAVTPALFPRSAVAPEHRVPGRVAVLVPPQVRAAVHDPMREVRIDVRLPLGRVIEQALLVALGDAARGGVLGLEVLPPAGSGLDATVVVDAVRAGYHRRLKMLLPAPPPLLLITDHELEARLAFDLSLFDANGQRVWTRTYDGGTAIVKRPSIWRAETPDDLVALAHETAWQLSQQVVTDLRDWLVAERHKPREL